VRIPLAGRRVRGWVVAVDVEPTPGVDAKAILGVAGAGPPPEVVSLARWAAHRWAGRWAHLLRAASPPANARLGGGLGRSPSMSAADTDGGVVVRRVGPRADRLRIVLDAVAAGPCIVVVPEVDAAARLADRLRREGHRVALLTGESPVREWEHARAGGHTVVGTRVAVWAPVPDDDLAGIVVLDEHDEALQSEQAPTWHARDVAIERARRAGAGCTLVSPTPTLHALAAGDLQVAAGGWPRVEVVDRRGEDPMRGGLVSPRLADVLRTDATVVCVLNRTGRSRLLACASCGTTATCARCDAAVVQPDGGTLHCERCGTDRPVVCLGCGSGRFRNLRRGVARVQEELGDRVVVDTEAVLHRLKAGSVDVVAVLDLDQELLAPRYRAGELALTLLGRAARAASDRLLLQTRLPDHPVVDAARHGDPGRFTDAEQRRRAELGYPPAAALAVVSGTAAAAWAAGAPPPPLGVEVLGPADGRYLVRAATWDALADFLDAVPRPSGRVRVEVDPARA
jgi:primosomal protein N' (replication factor Y)